MKKIIIAFLIFIPLTLFCQQSEISCKELKEGVFKLESLDGSNHIITRIKNKQQENVAKEGTVTEMEIRWLTECTYLLFNCKVIKGVDDIPRSP